MEGSAGDRTEKKARLDCPAGAPTRNVFGPAWPEEGHGSDGHDSLSEEKVQEPPSYRAEDPERALWDDSTPQKGCKAEIRHGWTNPNQVSHRRLIGRDCPGGGSDLTHGVPAGGVRRLQDLTW